MKAWWKERSKQRIIFLFSVITLFLVFFWLIRPILLPFLLAFFLAYILSPLVRRLEAKGLSRIRAILVIYLFLGLVSSLTCYYGLPILYKEVSALMEATPQYIQQFNTMLDGLHEDYEQAGLPQGIRSVIDEKIDVLEGSFLNFLSKLLESFVGVVGYLVAFLLAPLLAFYLLKDGQRLSQDFQELIPPHLRTDCMALLRDVDEVVKTFLRGHLLVALIVGALSIVAFWIIDLPFAVFLGVLTGIADIVPFFGPFIGAGPVLLIALLDSWNKVFLALGVIILIQQIENHIITPKILGDALGLHPVTIILVLLAGGHLYGVVGVLLAVPVTASIKVILRFIFLKLVAGGND